jgi:tetratricopeptide (TPR) repeat protein
MKIEKKYCSDLNSILGKFLLQEQIHKYIETIALDFLPQQALRMTSDEHQLNDYFNENIQTKKIRLLSDTLVTYVSKILEEERYIEFLLEFGKLIITRGENNLTLDIALMVYSLVDKKKKYENHKAQTFLLFADFHMRQASWKEAFNAIKSAKAIFELLGNRSGLGECEFLIGSAFVEQGDLKAGKFRLENCLTYLKQEDDPMLFAMIDVHLGIIAFIEGNLESALNYYNRAQSKFELLGDERRRAETLLNKGVVYRNLGQIEKAIEIFNESSDIARQNGYLPTLNLCFINKAEIYLQKEELERSYKYSQKAIELSYLLNDRLSIADVHRFLGIIAKKQKNYSLAENYLLTSLRLNHELNEELNAAETDYELGLLYKEKGNKDTARVHLTKALKYYNQNNSKAFTAVIESQLSSLMT